MRIGRTGWAGAVGLVVGLLVVVCTACGAETWYDNQRVWKSDDPNFNFRRSEHFRVIWGKGVGEGNVNNDYGLMNEQRVQGHLQSLEKIWHKYHDPEPAGLGFPLDGTSTDPKQNEGKRYRTNFAFNNTGIWEGGAWGATDDFGFQLFAINPGFTSYDPPTGATAHEYGHTMQTNGGGFNDTPYDGMWHEACANWVDCQFIDDQDAGPMATCHTFSLPHGRDYYHSYQIWEYLREQPAYGVKFYDTMWTQANGNKAKGAEYIFDAMVRLDPSGDPDPYNKVKDNLGHMAEHNLTWDYERGVFWRAEMPMTFDPLNGNYRGGINELERVMGSDKWYRVPFEHAPSQGGYDLIPIALNGKNGGGYVVNIDFKPLWDASRGSDWRACLVAVNDNGEPRYGNQWNCGVNGITLSADENKLFLVVTAVPDFMGFEGFSHPLVSDPVLFPQSFEIAFVNTKADAYVSASPARPEGVTGKVHANGGGFVADTAKVDASAYVGKDAQVLGNAQVLGHARIEDYAVVMGDAVVKDNAVITGHGLVKDKAEVSGSAKVRDWATVSGSWKVYENARVLEHANLVDRGQIHGNATIKGAAADFGNCDVKGYAIKDGDCSNGASLDKGVLMCWVWGTDQSYADSRPDTGGVYCGYDFERTSPNYALDKFGDTQGYLMGNVPIITEVPDKSLGNVLVLGGSDEYVELHEDVFDFRDMTIAAWICWNGGKPGQSVFAFGSAKNGYMSLTPSNAAGKASFVIDAGRRGRTELTGASAIAERKWTHVALTFRDEVVTLYIDGKAVDTKPVDVHPDDLMGPNTLDGGTYAYLGRGTNGDYFRGAIDDFRVYGSAQSDELIATAAKQVTNRDATASVAAISHEEAMKRVVVSGNAEFRVKPTAISDTAVTMSAVRAKRDAGGQVEYFFRCVKGGGHDSGWISGSKYVDCGLKPGTTYFYMLQMRANGSVARDSKPVSVTTAVDKESPKFGKSEWESAPRGISDTAIKMVAAKASDINQLVEYKFTRNDGVSTGWRSTRTWIDKGLKPGAKYSYTVQARDGRGNVGKVSKAASAVARDDTPPARFVRGEWTTPAYVLLDGSVALRARPVHASGPRAVSIEDNEVQYFYKCISGGGPDSGWVDDPKWDTKPLPDGTYTYQFKMRDKSAQHNETGWSAPESTTVSNMHCYHNYKISELAGLPESAMVTFKGKVTEVGKDFYVVSGDGASVKVMPRTKGSATDASFKDKDVTVKGGTWIVSGEMRVTWADVE